MARKEEDLMAVHLDPGRHLRRRQIDPRSALDQRRAESPLDMRLIKRQVRAPGSAPRPHRKLLTGHLRRKELPALRH